MRVFVAAGFAVPETACHLNGYKTIAR